MPYFESSDGTELYYRTVGSGPQDFVLIHGSFMHSNIWEHQLFEFSEDARVISIDLRGHGMSEKPFTGYSLKTYADDIEALTEAVDVDSGVLAGWSLGALVALFTASRQNTPFSRLALISSGLFHMVSNHDEREEEYIPYNEFIQNLKTERPAAMRWFVEMIFGKTASQATKNWVWQMTLKSALHANVNTMESVTNLEKKDLRDRLRNVDVPVGIFHGDCDLAALPEEANFVADKLVHQGSLYRFQESGHLPFLEQATKFNDMFREFSEIG